MNKTKTEKKRSYGRFLFILLIIALLCSAAALSPAAAKYLTQGRNPENLVVTENFYFTSNYLDETAPVIPVSAGTSAVAIELYNYDDALRVSELDINYTITLEVKKLDDTAAEADVISAASLTPTGGTLAKGALKHSAAVTLDGLKGGYKYIVTAVGSNGFTKTISATFAVAAEQPAIYKHLTKSDDYVLLTVWTEGDANGTVSIRYPASLVPDNTDPAMRAWVTGASTGTTAFGRYESHMFRFFCDPSTVTADDFAVTLNGMTATDKDPQS